MSNEMQIKNTKPVTEEYAIFQKAYDHFNTALFNNCLPHVLITYQRKKSARGYFWADIFQSRTEQGETVHELAMNPAAFEGRSDKDIFSTLVHEMAHVWQQCYAKPGKGGYHNTEWGNKMKAIGLYPSNTGQPGGKETGIQMTHYIMQDGPYSIAYEMLFNKGILLNWQSGKNAAKKTVNNNYTKFECPCCGMVARAKPDAHIICGDCQAELEAVIK